MSLQELCQRKNLSSEIGSIAQENWVHSRFSDGANTVGIFASLHMEADASNKNERNGQGLD